MKRSDDFSEIGEWLRSHKPEISTPPGLEAKIQRALNSENRIQTHRRPVWMWFAIPPAFACLVFCLLPKRPESAPVVDAAPKDSQAAPDEMILVTNDPLLAESKALSRDLERAGGFLVNCLPSLDLADSER